VPAFDGLASFLLELLVEGEGGEALAEGAGDAGDGPGGAAHHPAEHAPHPDSHALGKLAGTLHSTLQHVMVGVRTWILVRITNIFFKSNVKDKDLQQSTQRVFSGNVTDSSLLKKRESRSYSTSRNLCSLLSDATFANKFLPAQHLEEFE
jgi:hypothetical protein